MYVICLLLSAGFYVNADFAVYNVIRSFDKSEDVWGRPIYTPQTTVYVSFYQYLRFPTMLGWVPWAIVNRGWWTGSQVREIHRCTEGLILESMDGINVIVPELRVIHSPFDWEMRHRRLYIPIRKP